jgi:hypothetical protein
MKNIVIKIHSFVDVITNSSTSIYVESSESSVKMTKELIAKLFKASNINKSVDELFDIYIEADDLIIKPKKTDQEAIRLKEQIQGIFEI